MRVGVGYSDRPDTYEAGREAAHEALEGVNRTQPCDMVLLFATSRHDFHTLRAAVADVVGSHVPILGGGAVGAMHNTRYGYAGDQIVLAAIWFGDGRCDFFVEGDLHLGEAAAGARLGAQLAAAQVTPESSIALFYDVVNRTNGDLRLIMATHVLAGLEQGLGFLPDINGAGLQGDFGCTATPQWTGHETSQHNVFALCFDDDIRIDTAIMHGCKPVTSYYTVTKADEQTILEINGEPALVLMDRLLGGSIPIEGYPFFLILGVNSGDKWGGFDEENYASRLCLAIDKERGGIVMFEPDMVAGTVFQVMYRSPDLDYIGPKIEQLFSNLSGREPVFALYIDCAGRAAGYSGIDMEDAVVVQNSVAGRAPLLGIYTGVEIASVKGRPRGLDWTGVFCLLSRPQ